MPRRGLPQTLTMRHDEHYVEALAASVPVLKGAQLAELRPGVADPTSVSLVIGPGTGLGVGAFVPAGKSAWAVISGEGQLFLVKEGESVTSRYVVAKVSEDSVELKDTADGSIRRLSLK